MLYDDRHCNWVVHNKLLLLIITNKHFGRSNYIRLSAVDVIHNLRIALNLDIIDNWYLMEHNTENMDLKQFLFSK